MTKSTGVGRGTLPITRVDDIGRVCTKCFAYRPWRDFYASNKGARGYTARCRSCIDVEQATTGPVFNRKLKQRAMDAYGGVCACCGESELAFLTIDHVNGDGAAHRKETKTRGGAGFYKWLHLNDYPKGFQVLCANCNLGRAVNGGICPHRTRV